MTAFPATGMRATNVPAGYSIPVLGQGTWRLGEGRHDDDEEVAALRLGIDLGMTLIDTAESYGDGAVETLVGKAIAGRRLETFLVSKVLPQHATRRGTIRACEQSLHRLGTDYLDLYLLHWRGDVPLEDTLIGFESLVAAGKIRCWGVSNLDVPDMKDLADLPGGQNVQTDQVLYNLTRRGIELELMQWCRERFIPIMAYAPIEQGRLLGHVLLHQIAKEHGATPAQIALAWVLSHEGVVAIPAAGTTEHVRQNRGALDVLLTDQDVARLERTFPRPQKPQPLETL